MKYTNKIKKIEFVRNKRTKSPFPPKAAVAHRIQETALKPEYSVSLFAGTGTVEGKFGDHIILAPPYNVSKEEIDVIVDVAGRVVEEVFKGLDLELEE